MSNVVNVQGMTFKMAAEVNGIQQFNLTNGTILPTQDVMRAEDIGNNNRPLVIGIMAGVSMMVVVLVFLLCRRELARRKEDAEFSDELERRQTIKKHVKTTLEQMKGSDDNLSYIEQMKAKVPFVTWGGVTSISLLGDALHHRQLSHVHLPHHEHHHHHYNLLDGIDDDPHGEGDGSHTAHTPHGTHVARAHGRMSHGDHHHKLHGLQTSKTSLVQMVKEVFIKPKRLNSTSSDVSSDVSECEVNEGVWMDAAVDT